MRRPLQRPGGRTTDLRGGAKTAELHPGDATTIYKLGYAAGQASMSTDAKLLKDEWWKGYATGLGDAYGYNDDELAGTTHTLDSSDQGMSPGHAPTGDTAHRLTLLPGGGGSVPRRRARREHLRLHHGGAS